MPEAFATNLSFYLKNFLTMTSYVSLKHTWTTMCPTIIFYQRARILPFIEEIFSAHSGGVVIFVSNRLFSKRRLDLELPSVQCIWLEIKFHSNSFLLCSSYGPPNSRVSVWDDLNVSIEKALDTSSNVIIVGENLLSENFIHLKTSC